MSIIKSESTEKAINQMIQTISKKIEVFDAKLASKHVDDLRSIYPNAKPKDLVKLLENEFIKSVVVLGALDGTVAFLPGVGTTTAIVLSLATSVAFVELATLYVMALADVYGLSLSDLERRRALLALIIMGEPAEEFVSKMAKRTGGHWARKIVNDVPMHVIRDINRTLGKNFVTKYGRKQGVLVLGRVVPLGIGTLIGGVGNFIYATLVVNAARRAFGPPPEDWSGQSAPILV